MQRLAHLENNGVVTGPIRARWQSTFLELLYTMCTTVQAPFVSPLLFAHTRPILDFVCALHGTTLGVEAQCVSLPLLACLW